MGLGHIVNLLFIPNFSVGVTITVFGELKTNFCPDIVT